MSPRHQFPPPCSLTLSCPLSPPGCAAPVAFPPGQQKCCSKKCPDDFPIFISDTVCASLTGKQRTVDRKCLPRKPCDADEVKLDILPRNTTSVACPSKPPGERGCRERSGRWGCGAGCRVRR